MADLEYTDLAIGDLGTQFFWFNETSKKFEYAVPVQEGAEFGGDNESFDIKETDLDYTGKLLGRTNNNDVTYTVNYTAEKYKRVQNISQNGKKTYMEVLDGGSAMIFQGTSGRPTITQGDVRQITLTIAPSFMQWIENINDVTAEEKAVLTALNLDGITAEEGEDEEKKVYINIDEATIPTARKKYYEGHTTAE